MKIRRAAAPRPADPAEAAPTAVVPPAAPAPEPARPRLSRQLVDAGIVDRAYLEAQAGRTFANDEAAAAHLVRHPLMSPHPLLDWITLPEWHKERLEAGEVGVLLRYLRTPAAANRPLSGVFDPRDAPGTVEEKTAHPGGPLGLWLASATDDTPLPTRPDLTLGKVRRLLIAHLERFQHQAALVGSRLREEWDAAAEQEWCARFADWRAPGGEGPLVSVVMPVRNRASVVGGALASLRAQSLAEWELVVVDDGSTDDTASVVAEWAAQDPRIRLVSQEWAGVSAARNRGLAEAAGRYVAFLDSDNAWRPDFLRLAVAAMSSDGLRAAYAGMALHDGDDAATTVYRAFEGSRDELLVVNHVDLNVLVAELDLAREVGGFDTAMRRWVDHDFALRLARRVDLTLLPFLAVDYDNAMDAADRITTTESSAWQFVALGQHWVDWDGVAAGVDSRVPGRLSVSIPTWNDASMTVRAVRALLAHSDGLDLEVVVVDNGSQQRFGLGIVSAFLDDPRVRYVRLPRNLNFAIGSNVGFATGTGEHTLFLNNDTEVRSGWWRPLLSPLADDTVLGVQPLLLYQDDTIQTAGTVFPCDDCLPCHYLVDHSGDDVWKIRDRRFHTVTAAALAMRSADVSALRGFDPIFVNGMEDVDLCLRAAALTPGGAFVLAPSSRVTHYEGRTEGRINALSENRAHFLARWRGRLPAGETHRWLECGFEVAHLQGEMGDHPRPRPMIIRPKPVDPGPSGPAPALRWGLKLPSIAGERGDEWGDTHFAASLAASLQALRQDTVSWRHWAHWSQAARLDDVVLVIRGLDDIRPSPGKVNVLWVISHPDDVTVEELHGYDLVYAASPTWAAAMSERSGRLVGTLLQATDLRRRADMSTPVGAGERAVFVGQTLVDRVRPIVEDAVAAGVPLDVHGPNWDGKLPPGVWRSSYVANDRLMQLYRDHGLVLADHHGDMAAEGFLANRLFDAVASGARVVSDPIAGTELFEGAVQTYDSPVELAALCASPDRFPPPAELAAISDRVAAAHSFDARAAQLLADVVPVWRRKALPSLPRPAAQEIP